MGAVAALALVAAVEVPGAAAQTPSVGGCQLFPPYAGPAGARSAPDETAWNQDVSQSPRDPRSRRYMRRIRRLGGNQHLHPDFGSNPHYGIPFAVVPESQPLVPIDFTAYGDESDPGPYPIPADAPVEGGSGSNGDRHVLVVEQGACHLFELGRGFFTDPGWDANVGVNWDLTSAGLRQEYWTSADAAGLPILPGLVRHDEVEAGAVGHAIRVTFEATRRAFIHPASHYASSRCGRDLPPMGLRLRLKRPYYKHHVGDFPASSEARPIFDALYHYGLIVADNGANWYLTGEGDQTLWNDDELNALKDVPGGAFVVVDSKAPATSDC
jgi:hypothetical protein